MNISKKDKYTNEFFSELNKNTLIDPLVNCTHLSDYQQKIILELNNNALDYPREKLVHELIEERVKISPNKTALIFGKNAITYYEMNRRSNIIAKTLVSKGVKSNDIIALMMKRSLEMIVGIIGILKAGGAYLPIDPELPKERINYMLNDSNSKLLLTTEELVEGLNFTGNVIYFDDINHSKYEPSNLDKLSTSLDLAYVIYTSGSTGKPKGVMIEHRSVVNLIYSLSEKINFDENKKILNLSTISFDIFVIESLLPLARGLTVIIANEQEQKNPKLLSDLIIRSNIDMIQVTPSRMQLLINYDKMLSCLHNISDIMLGGEKLPQSILETIQKYSKAKIYNLYGPTEATVWSTLSDLSKKNKVDIGKPISNTKIYILDENRNLLDIDHEGELYIGGDGLARGYLNDQKLTNERFIPNPFIPSERLYKTGDIAKWLPDGNIEYIGRIDNQVKIRGHRVELEEIESHLLMHKSVKQAVVTAKEGKENTKYLYAYFVAEGELVASDLRNYLSNILPDYMVPTYFIKLENLPQTQNGKIDRNALLSNETQLNLQLEHKFCNSEVNITKDKIYLKIKEIIRSNIDTPMTMECIDINENLNGLGINSISFIKIVVAIENEFGFEFRDEELDVNKFPTIKSLIEYVSLRQAEMQR